jgi:hypothetical protein
MTQVEADSTQHAGGGVSRRLRSPSPECLPADSIDGLVGAGAGHPVCLAPRLSSGSRSCREAGGELPRQRWESLSPVGCPGVGGATHGEGTQDA